MPSQSSKSLGKDWLMHCLSHAQPEFQEPVEGLADALAVSCMPGPTCMPRLPDHCASPSVSAYSRSPNEIGFAAPLMTAVPRAEQGEKGALSCCVSKACPGRGAMRDLPCTAMPGLMKQLDAGNGELCGVTDNGNIFRWTNQNWVQLPGQMRHVTVGPAGLWAVTQDYNIYNMRDNNWVQVTGLLQQIDAGGDKFLVGTNFNDNVFCVNQDAIDSKATSLPWSSLDRTLRYYSCGPLGCWGVNSDNQTFYRYSVTPTNCLGSQWSQVDGSLVMVEAGTDGSVYGVDPEGNVYKS
eukprot:XP_017951205.1 PREDICTED: fish-egg lectin-like [Xenopus tropicalis]